MIYSESKNIILNYISKISIDKILSIAIVLSSLSLALIAIRLGPVSNYSKSFNKCVGTTTGFLGTVPGFQTVGKDGLEAMAVSLCNGSTPQKVENSSPNKG